MLRFGTHTNKFSTRALLYVVRSSHPAHLFIFLNCATVIYALHLQTAMSILHLLIDASRVDEVLAAKNTKVLTYEEFCALLRQMKQEETTKT